MFQKFVHYYIVSGSDPIGDNKQIWLNRMNLAGHKIIQDRPNVGLATLGLNYGSDKILTLKRNVFRQKE